MEDSLRRPPEAWALVVAGAVWLVGASASGALAFLVAALPGALLLACGVGALLIWDDPRVRRYGALGALLGVLLALPLGFLVGGVTALLLLALAAAAFVAAGMLALRETDRVDGVPAPVPALGVSAEVAGDDAMLALFDIALPKPTEEAAERHVRELAEAEEHFTARGWLEKPERFHVAPPPFAAVASEKGRAARVDFEHLSCPSGYEPHEGEPGRERWLGYARVHTAHA